MKRMVSGWQSGHWFQTGFENPNGQPWRPATALPRSRVRARVTVIRASYESPVIRPEVTPGRPNHRFIARLLEERGCRASYIWRASPNSA